MALANLSFSYFYEKSYDLLLPRGLTVFQILKYVFV